MSDFSTPFLNKLVETGLHLFDIVDTCACFITTTLFMVITGVMYATGTMLFYLWDTAMTFGGRKQLVWEYMDNKPTNLYMKRYAIWFKDSEDTNKYNIFIHHYITSTEEYYTDPWKSYRFMLHGTLRQDNLVEKADNTSYLVTKLRRKWSTSVDSPSDIKKYIVKPNTTCWELVITTKKTHQNKMFNVISTTSGGETQYVKVEHDHSKTE